MAFEGSILIMQREGGDTYVPAQLLDGEEHFDDDHDRGMRCRRAPLRYEMDKLPRESMRNHVYVMVLKRPRR